MPNDAWLDRRYYGGDLPAAAERALHAVGQDWHDEAAAERHIRAALALAPDHLAVQIAAYKFFFYRHRLAEARSVYFTQLTRPGGRGPPTSITKNPEPSGSLCIASSVTSRAARASGPESAARSSPYRCRD